MIRIAFATAIAVAFAAAIPASATTLTFNNAGAVDQVLGNNIVESGYQISASQCAGTNCFFVRAAPTQGAGSDGKVLQNYAFNPAITIARAGGGAFTLQSLAITGVDLPFAFLTNFDVVFGFSYADGSSALFATSIDANFSNPTSYVIGSQLSAYTNKALTSFFVQADYDSQAGASLQIDNITVTDVGAVPEPGTWAMMVGGFGLVGGALRRRHRTNVRFA